MKASFRLFPVLLFALLFANFVAAPLVNSCMTITSSGTYTLDTDLTHFGAGSCIRVDASDVVLDCAGHSLTGDDTFGSLGIAVTSSDSGTDLSNVTVKNCIVSDFGGGIAYGGTDNSLVEHVTVNSNNGYGISLADQARYVTLRDIIATNNDEDGILLIYTQYDTLEDITATGNKHGIRLSGVYETTVTNAVLNGNNQGGGTHQAGLVIEFCAFIDGGTGLPATNITATNITANSNARYGVYMKESADITLTDIIANDNGLDGVFIDRERAGATLLIPANHILTNVTANNNNRYGIFLRGDSLKPLKNIIITNSTANNNDYAFYLEDSTNTTLSGNDFCNNITEDVYCEQNQADFSNNLCDSSDVCGGICIACAAGPGCSSLAAVPNSGVGPFASVLAADFSDAEGLSVDFDCGNGVTGSDVVSGGSASFDCDFLAVAVVTNYTVSATEPVSGAFCTANVTVNPPAGVPQCVVSVDTSPIDVGDSTTVTVSYSDFAGVPAYDSVDCDDSTAVDSGFVCGATCDFTCGIYSDFGLHAIDVSLLDGITYIPCASDALTVNLPSLPGSAEFQIVSFDLSENFVSVDAAEPVSVDAVVRIRNIGGEDGDATLTIIVKDKVGVEVATDSVPSFNLVGGASANSVLVFDIPADWEPGLYTFYANLYDADDSSFDDQKIRVLTVAITKSAPVPEFSILLLPLMLAIVLFVLKKK